jgi:hypothetical protein
MGVAGASIGLGCGGEAVDPSFGDDTGGGGAAAPAGTTTGVTTGAGGAGEGAAPSGEGGFAMATGAGGAASSGAGGAAGEPPTVTAVMSSAPPCPGRSTSYVALAAPAPTAWDWKLGGGAVPDTSNDAAPAVVFADAGSYQAAVSVSNDAGSSPPYAFSIDVPAPAVPSWQSHAPDTAGFIGSDCGATSVGGKPAVAYWDFANGDLKVALAKTASPAAPGDWVAYTLESANNPGWLCSAAELGGAMVIAHRENANGDLRFARALVAAPASPADWQTHAVDTEGDLGGRSAIVVLNGEPWVSYYDYTKKQVKVAHAATGTPSAQTDWAKHGVAVATGSMGQYFTSMTSLGGKLAVSFEDQGTLKVAIAKVGAPKAPQDWSVHVVDAGPGVGMQSSIAALDGRLAVAYRDNLAPALKLARALVAAPTAAADWNTQKVVSGLAVIPNLLAVDGRLALSYATGQDKPLMLARAVVREPAALSDWSVVTVDAVGGYDCAVAKGATLVLAYQGGMKDLMVAEIDGACW